MDNFVHRVEDHCEWIVNYFPGLYLSTGYTHKIHNEHVDKLGFY